MGNENSPDNGDSVGDGGEGRESPDKDVVVLSISRLDSAIDDFGTRDEMNKGRNILNYVRHRPSVVLCCSYRARVFRAKASVVLPVSSVGMVWIQTGEKAASNR